MPHKRVLIPILFVGTVLGMAASVLQAEQNLHRVWAVQNAKVLTSPLGPPLDKATVIIRDGVIEAVGPGLPVPAEAEVIAGEKLLVFPGLVDVLGKSLLKLPEEKFDPMKIYSGDYSDKDKGITPELKAFEHIGLGKSAVEKFHKLGFLACQVIPDKGIFTGQSSLFCLSSEDKNRALLLKDSWLGVGFSPAGLLGGYPGSLMGVVAYLRQSFADAQHYDLAAARWRSSKKGFQRPAFDPRMEALSGYLAGRKPIVFLCGNQHDIRRALALAAEYKLDYFIADLGGEAWRAIPELRAARARVLCAVTFKPPLSSLLTKQGKDLKEKAEKELYPKNAARLAEAGIRFAFTSLGADDPKSFLEGVRKAVEAGLPREKALEALTTAPAAFLGLDGALGSLEPGKIANLVLAEDDILAKDPKVKAVFADGERFEFKAPAAGEGEKPAVNISGRWEINAEGAPKLTADILQEEASFSGKMTTPFGVFDFTGGTVSGSEIFFEMNISVAGQDIDLYFSATVEGETMRGTVVQGTSGSGEFTAKRIPG